jgi:hypothetical protein
LRKQKLWHPPPHPHTHFSFGNNTRKKIENMLATLASEKSPLPKSEQVPVKITTFKISAQQN